MFDKLSFTLKFVISLSFALMFASWKNTNQQGVHLNLMTIYALSFFQLCFLFRSFIVFE